jgi:ABC-type multidrug transport system fused ATPase/permease subunit
VKNEAEHATLMGVLRSKSMRIALIALLHQKWYALSLMGTMLLDVGIKLAYPFFLRLFFEYAVKESNTGMMYLVLAGLIILPVMGFILTGLNFSLQEELYAFLDLRLQEELRKKRVSPYVMSASYSQGEIQRGMTDLSGQTTSLLAYTMPSLVSSVIMGISCFLTMITISLPITLMVVITTPLLLLSGRSIKKLKLIQANLFQIRDRISQSTVEFIRFSSTLQLNVAEARENQHFQKLRKEYMTSRRKSFFVELFGVNIYSSLTEVIGVGLVYLVGMILTQAVPVGQAFQLATYVTTFQGQIGLIQSRGISVIKSAPDVNRFDDLLNLEEPIVDPDPIELKEVDSIELVGVTACYSGKTTPAIRAVSLSIRRGERIALVGESGSGKSTILHLLVRFLEPSEGKILINGLPIQRYTLESLRRAFILCSQESSILGRTVEENIRLGKPDATGVEVVRAARAAAIHEAILNMPQQYATLITDLSLSGGEGQRIGLARSLLRVRRRYVLMLDESTSDVDPKTERQMIKGLDRETTTIIVAHRYSTIAGVDTIYVLQNGQIVECDSLEMLLQKRGIFHALWEQQMPGQQGKVDEVSPEFDVPTVRLVRPYVLRQFPDST